MRRSKISLCICVLVLTPLWACEPPGPIEPAADASTLNVDEGAWAEALTPSLRGALGSGGLLQAELSQSQRYRPTISAEEAVTLANQWVARKATYVRAYLERGHGGPIDLAALRPDGRPIIAETPHQPLPAELANPWHKNWGPYYLVTFRQDDVPAVMVAVSAFATDLQIGPDGALSYTGNEGVRGNEFRWWGVPASGLVVSPELAAVVASQATGALVAERPVYVRRQGRFVPTIGWWRIALDRQVTGRVAPDGGRVAVDEVFVDGRSGVILAPSPTSAGAAGISGLPQLEFPLAEPALQRLVPFDFHTKEQGS